MSVMMGKEASLEGLEFDGDTVLCRVCGDKASGFHYGVHACEGCKGFFRRSIQQKIQYRPCLKNQQCNIMRVNRNRCQYCRLKKCISVGMSRDAVRFGRVPKKEKARIIEQMQKSNLQMVATAMSSALSAQDMVQAVILAHHQTCDLGPERAKVMREIALLKNDYVDCPAHMACPLNSQAGVEMTDNQDWVDFSEFFAPAIKSVVDFAKIIPGFLLLNQDDQITLLKAATFEVLLVRMACLFDTDSNTMMFGNGKLFRRQTAGLSASVGFLLDSMFDFADRFNKLNLNDDELALFSAVVLLSPDRPGLRQMEQVEKIQSKLTESLQNMINTNHKEDNTLFAKLVLKTTDLRTLNALHAEKTVGQNEEGEMQDSQGDTRSEDSTPSDSMSSIATHTSCSTVDTASMYDSNSSLVHAPSRYSTDVASGAHQQSQVVLKTPYGMFLREDTGYYGMVPEQPRRRCHTLDRDSQISKPRLHTIEEGTRRRFTMDRDYINKMVGKLSDRLEKRAHVNSMPGSVNNSAASSPVPIFEEQYSHMNRNFIPISTPDSSACSSRTSPSLHRDALQPFASSPNSPRPRSGSIGTDDFGPMRPRCASFHVNSEGHASQVRPYPTDHDFLSADGQHHRMPAEMRRGSVGASYNLHAKKKSLLVDRHPAYLSQIPDAAMFRKSEKQRSPLANEEPTKRHIISSDGSAFEQVPHLTVPLTLPWGSNLPRPEVVAEPPKVSVTAPADDVPSGANIVPIASINERNMCPMSSPRSSPDEEEMKDSNEERFHKKFDKFRKYMAAHSTNEETQQMEKLSLNDVESMESSDYCIDDEADDSNGASGAITGSCDQESRGMSSSAGTANDKAKMSARDAHPQLLAQLKTGPQFKPTIHPAFPTVAAGPPAFIPHHHPLQQHTMVAGANNAGAANISAIASVTNGKKAGGSLSPNNIVLSVPQSPFVNRSPNVSPTVGNSGSSMMSNHPCLQNILNRRDNSLQARDQFTSIMDSTSSSHGKDSEQRNFPSSENLTKIEDNGAARHVPPPHTQHFRNGHAHPNMFQCGFEQGAAAGVNVYDPQQYMMYQQLYLQQQQAAAQQQQHGGGVTGIRVPQYNEHLAGMQQMVYGGNQQQHGRGGEGDIPLNLTQTVTEPADTNNFELVKKIKEEVIS